MKEFVSKLFISCVAVLAPIQAVINTIFILCAVDFITGIWGALKRKEKIQSRKMRESAGKLLVYMMAIICGFLVEIFLIDKSIPITKIVGGFIGIIELKSIGENTEKILGYNIFEKVLSMVKPQTPPSNPQS